MATSLYNSKNEDIAPALVKILLESDNKVPDFLQGEVPPDGKLEFDDDTDDEGEDGGTDAWGGAPAGDAWGAPAADNGGNDAWCTAPANPEPAGDNWGTPAGGEFGDSW